MINRLFPEGGAFFKANLHTHSIVSDGKLSPKEIKDYYQSEGYSVVAFTDHNVLVAHPELTDSSFVALVGFELEFVQHYDSWGPPLTTHFGVIQKNPCCFDPLPHDPTYTTENIQKELKLLKEHGYYVILNHPTDSLLSYQDYIRYHDVDCMEIYNHNSFLSGKDEHNAHVLHDFLKLGNSMKIVATDDFHKPGRAFGGVTYIWAESLTYEHIIHSLEKGWFYASEGPCFSDFYLEDDHCCVSSNEPLQYIRFLTDSDYSKLVLPQDNHPLYEGKFWIEPHTKWFRVELADSQGKRAYSQPIIC